MPRFLRLQNKMIHVPSVSNVSMGTNCWGRPTITLSFHSDKKLVCISYKDWQVCEKEFNKIKDAVTEVENILKEVRLTESSTVFSSEPEITLTPIKGPTLEEAKKQLKENEEANEVTSVIMNMDTKSEESA